MPFFSICRKLTLAAFGLALLSCAPVFGQTTGALPPPPPWSRRKAAYDYNSKTRVPVTESPCEDSEALRLHLEFTDSYGLRVTGIFMRPKADGVYSCVLLLHGSGGNKGNMINAFGESLAKRGMASLALDAWNHGERSDQKPSPDPDQRVIGSITRITVVDYRIALDYLATRKDVNSQRIGLMGYSMGSLIGAVLSGVEERIGATLLCVGGDPVRPLLQGLAAQQRAEGELVSPSNYVGHISPRALMMINGTKDTAMMDGAKLLHAAAQEPREIVWVESGHALPRSALEKGMDWLAIKLGARPDNHEEKR